jgi:hypothetical protein
VDGDAEKGHDRHGDRHSGLALPMAKETATRTDGRGELDQRTAAATWPDYGPAATRRYIAVDDLGDKRECAHFGYSKSERIKRSFFDQDHGLSLWEEIVRLIH